MIFTIYELSKFTYGDTLYSDCNLSFPHMKFFTVVTTVMLITLSPPVVFAMEQGGSNGKKRFETDGEKDSDRVRLENRGGGHHRSFRRLDENSDGFLSFKEFSQSARLASLTVDKRQALFDFLDHNKDQKLDLSELGHRHPEWLLAIRNNFKSLDIDQDQKLSFKEFIVDAVIAEKPENERVMLFKYLDRNKDESIDLNELKKKPRGKNRLNLDFENNDLDQSGGLNYIEYSNLPFVSRFDDERRKKHFERIDSNNNGEISLKEIHAAHKRRPRLQHDGRDGPSSNKHKP